MAELFHLPDLPIAGYQTERQRQITDDIMVFLRHVERERLEMLTIVLAGRDVWRRKAKVMFGMSEVTQADESLDEMFRYMQLLAAGSAPAVQKELLACLHNSIKWREQVDALTPHWEMEREMLAQRAKWMPGPMDTWTLH